MVTNKFSNLAETIQHRQWAMRVAPRFGANSRGGY
jgi:hypothetical protein